MSLGESRNSEPEQSGESNAVTIKAATEAIKLARSTIQSIDKSKWGDSSIDALSSIERYVGQALIVGKGGYEFFREDVMGDAVYILLQYENENLRKAINVLLRVFDLTLADVDVAMSRQILDNGEVTKIHPLSLRLYPKRISNNIRQVLKDRFPGIEFDEYQH